jgi:hypothetical protein
MMKSHDWLKLNIYTGLDTHTEIVLSCLTNLGLLDNPCCHWSAIHTDILLEMHAFNEETLWKVYNIVPGATVSPLHYVCILFRDVPAVHIIFPQG